MELRGEYLTISEIADRLGISYLAAKQRLLRYGIKPITSDTLYEESALEAVRNVPGKGRPRKAAEQEASPEPAKRRAKKSEE